MEAIGDQSKGGRHTDIFGVADKCDNSVLWHICADRTCGQIEPPRCGRLNCDIECSLRFGSRSHIRSHCNFRYTCSRQEGGDCTVGILRIRIRANHPERHFCITLGNVRYVPVLAGRQLSSSTQGIMIRRTGQPPKANHQPKGSGADSSRNASYAHWSKVHVPQMRA